MARSVAKTDASTIYTSTSFQINTNQSTVVSAVFEDQVGVAAVVITGEERKPFALRRPDGAELELVAVLDGLGVGAVGVGDVDLVVLVIKDALAVGRRVEAVDEAGPFSERFLV